MRRLILSIGIAATVVSPAVAIAAPPATEPTPAPAPAATPPTPAPAATPPTPAPAATPPTPAPAAIPPTPAPLVRISPPAADTGTQEQRAPEGPIESRFNVSIDFDTVWYAKPSYDLFSSHDNSFYPGVRIGYALVHLEPVWLIPELGFNANSEGSSGLFGGAISSTSLDTKNVYGGLSARWDLLSFLDLAARVSGGASFVHFDVAPSSGTPGSLTDDGVSPFLTLGGGFTIHTPAGMLGAKSRALRSLVGGVSVESGYLFGGSLQLNPSRTDDTNRIKTVYQSLGTVERSGPYLKVSLTSRF